MRKVDLKEAVNLLGKGDLVCLPTDTIYGLVADWRNISAVEKIFELKGRPGDKPLAVLVDSEDSLNELVEEVTDKHRLLVKAFWPGALTLIFKKKASVPDIITAGQPTIGVRMPNNPLALKVIESIGGILVATSINRSGGASLNSPEEIANIFSELPVVESKSGNLRKESTVVDVTGERPRLLRLGYLGKAQIEEVLGEELV